MKNSINVVGLPQRTHPYLHKYVYYVYRWISYKNNSNACYVFQKKYIVYSYKWKTVFAEFYVFIRIVMLESRNLPHHTISRNFRIESIA